MAHLKSILSKNIFFKCFVIYLLGSNLMYFQFFCLRERNESIAENVESLAGIVVADTLAAYEESSLPKRESLMSD